MLRWKQRLVSTDSRVVFQKMITIRTDTSTEVNTQEQSKSFQSINNNK